MERHDFDTAKDELNDVRSQSSGSQAMKDRAKDMLSQVKKIKSNRSDLNKSIKNASDMFDNSETSQGMSLLKTVLDFKGINGKYYSDIYKKAVNLLADNTTGTSSSSSSSNSSDNNSSSSSSSSDSSNAAAGGDFDVESRKVNGKTITDSDISKARQDLTDQGVKNVAAWSDNDIVKAIKNASKDGRSTIKASDVKNQ
jgi:cobalamin biosynthesis Mg chelatase CobN